MPRSIWSGAISFGMVNIPIKLVSATDKKTVRFREIRRGDASRIRHKKVAAADDTEVPSEDLVKGYEIAPDRYIVVDPAELKGLDPVSNRTIEIEDFVELAEIDPIYFESSYYLIPGETASKPYQLLHHAMHETGKAGIARFVLRTKQYLAVIRPLDGALAISTMLYADEVVPVEALDGLPDDVEVADRELKMATQLIESMTTDWEPDRYEDTYRQKVLELLEKKAEGEEVATVPDDERESAEVVDLMSALEASLEAAGKEEAGSKAGGGEKKRKKRSA